MSQQADYLALSKGARMHLKRTSDNQFYFRTSGQVKWIIWGVIALVCLLGSLLMSVVLDGIEQVFYIGTSVFLIFFTALALGVRRHLVLDAAGRAIQLEKSWWGLGRFVQSQGALSNQRAVVAPIAELSEGCLLEIAGQKYTIGSLDETRQLARFIHQYFAVPAFDRVSQWPEEIELQSQRETGSLNDADPEKVAHGSKSPLADSRAEYESSASITDAQMKYASVWDQRIFLKLALPFPVFLVLGVILSLLANKGGG
jgi:hypothetical protein